MKSYEASLKISATADEVVKLITTAEYAEEEAVVDGAFSAKSRAESCGDNAVRIITERVDPSRGPNGKPIKDKKEKSTVTSEWDIAKMRSNWSTKVPGMEKLVKISGSTWIEPHGADCCRLCEKGSVSIGLPLVGDIIAKGIADDIKNGFPEKAKLIEKKLKK
jgi:hypothetical protein